MFKPTKAKTVAEYFAALPAERREPMEFLHTLIQKTAPKLMPNFIYTMPGHLPTLKRVIRLAAKSPGLIGAGERR